MIMFNCNSSNVEKCNKAMTKLVQFFFHWKIFCAFLQIVCVTFHAYTLLCLVVHISQEFDAFTNRLKKTHHFNVHSSEYFFLICIIQKIFFLDSKMNLKNVLSDFCHIFIPKNRKRLTKSNSKLFSPFTSCKVWNVSNVYY